MSTDVEETPEGDPGDPSAPAPAALEGGPTGTGAVLRTRLLLPLLIPLCAIAVLAVLAVNLSRVFLAGGKVGALIAASVVTIAILIGAAILSAKPELRSSSLTVIGAGVVVVVIGAGLVTLGAADSHHGAEAGGFQQPEGDPDATLAIEATIQNRFIPSDPAVGAGIVEVDLLCDACGSHTFVFEDTAFSGFELAVPGGPDVGKVEVEAGDYVFYCTIPGHRAAGMEGTLAVTGVAPQQPGDDAGGEGGTDSSTSTTSSSG